MAKMSFNEWPAITADDATIKAALEEANIPALMAALAHLTGSTAILRGDIQPNNNIFRDPQSGIAPEQQAKARAMAFEIITAYRDAGSRLPPVPDENSVREMMHYLIGQEISPDYVQFLMSELALNGEDPYSQAGINALPQRLKSQFKVAVIGAGMSGILAGIRLKEAGIPYVIFEKNGDVGGTWYENTYPGCRVDSPNHSYSYSFAPNDWPQYFSSQAVLRDYFDRCATEYGIRDAIHFNTEVVSAEFDETSKIWRLHLTAAMRARGRWSSTPSSAQSASSTAPNFLTSRAVIASRASRSIQRSGSTSMICAASASRSSAPAPAPFSSCPKSPGRPARC